MIIGKKLFPYPVLCNDKVLSSYINSKYNLVFDLNSDGNVIIEDDKVIFRNVHFELQDNDLKNYYDNGSIGCKMIVESSAAMFRKSYDITAIEQTIEIPLNSFSSDVEVSSYLYAKNSISGFSCANFQSVYKSYPFEIDKYDILAYDDGISFKVIIDISQDNKLSSIFSVVKLHEDSNVVTYNYSDKKITILLPEKYYVYYDNMKDQSNFQNIFFVMLAIPALTESLRDIVDSMEDDDEFDNDLIWLNSVRKKYEQIKGETLTAEYLRNDKTQCYQVAQTVLNNAVCNGLEDFRTFIDEANRNGVSDE